MQQPMTCVALTPELISCEETASCIKDNLSRSMNELSSYQLRPPIGILTLASVKVLIHSPYVWSPSKSIVMFWLALLRGCLIPVPTVNADVQSI